jgi:predicted nucleic acid-binding protein
LLASLVEGGETLACSVMTLMEIYAGVRPSEFPLTERFLDSLDHYDVKGRTLGVADLIIAATALAHDLVLMTDNRKDFPMPKLALYPLP